MPTHEDLVTILDFVEELPDRTKESVEEGLAPILARYPIDLEAFRPILEQYAHATLNMATTAMATTKLLHMVNPGEHPDPNFGQILDAAFQACLLRMYAFACEYQRRWVIPEMLEGLSRQLSEMEVGETDAGH